MTPISCKYCEINLKRRAIQVCLRNFLGLPHSGTKKDLFENENYRIGSLGTVAEEFPISCWEGTVRSDSVTPEN